MYYLYSNNRLKPLLMSPKEAINTATLCNGILVTNKIDEAIFISDYSKSAFLLHKKNAFSLFSYWKYQLKHFKLKEFKIIIFAYRKSFLYYLLSSFASFSLGKYRLIDFKSQKG